MNTKIKLLGLTSLALVACGDNKSRPDAATRRDSAPADAYCSNCPAAPTIGTTQIDRMGRPAINTALNKAFNDETPTTTPGDAAKDAYNANTTKATWPTTYITEFAQNIGILDLVDGGMTANGLCEFGETQALGSVDCTMNLQVGTGTGCGNTAGVMSYATKTTPTMAYGTLAGLLADDRLYLDTSKTSCLFYLAVEFGVLATPNTTCGGRAPAYDVIDFTYSAVAAGFGGFTTAFAPRIGDGVAAHTDLLAAFPYLGAPH